MSQSLLEQRIPWNTTGDIQLLSELKRNIPHEQIPHNHQRSLQSIKK